MAESSKCCEKIPARVVLGLMAFFMFLVTQMIRLNFNFALVAMSDNTDNSSYQGATWTVHTKGVLLGAFYWSYWLTELPGGLLAQQFGGHKTLLISVLAAGILNLLLPVACRWHYWTAALVRALQGLALGVTWPAMHSISAHWIPKTERSKFMTSYYGASVGTAVTYPLSGLIIANFGLDKVFYIIGVLTILWSSAWWSTVYDSPSQHPRLSYYEKKYLEQSLGKSLCSSKIPPRKTPWKAIVLSKPFWAVLMASQGLMWGTITLSMQVPAYLSSVHTLDIQTNGLISGLPDLSKFVFGLIFSSVMDHLLKQELLSITAVRKISVAVCEYFPALLLLLLAYLGSDDIILAATLLSLTTSMGGASSSGSLANIVDISPNFAGTILGLIKSLTVIPGILSPLLVSFLVNNKEPILCWQYVFCIIAAIYALCCSIFLVFGSGEVQSWNEAQSQTNIDLDLVKVEELLNPNEEAR